MEFGEFFGLGIGDEVPQFLGIKQCGGVEVLMGTSAIKRTGGEGFDH